jgi:negative regulator of sigma E activity
MIFASYRRSRALLTALVTLSVPGALTTAAVLGHLKSDSQTVGSEPAAALGTSLRAAAPVAQAPVVHARGKAIELLMAAAKAGESVPYEGEELISRWTLSGTDTVLASVWHASAGHTVTKATEAASVNGGFTQVSYDPYQQSPEGVFGVTSPLITLLASHYLAAMGGTGSVAGRTATIVDVTRPSGTLAARFWIDSKTSLPLRREDYDSDSHMISEAMFIQLDLGEVVLPDSGLNTTAAPIVAPAQVQRAAGLAAEPAPVQPIDLSTAWVDAQQPRGFLIKLRATGWPVPSVLPGGLSLYAAAFSQIANNSVVDLSYSDGLFEESLFVQPGVLATKLAGWQPAKIADKQVYTSSRGITWSAHGYVYTVMADAPPQTVAATVASLPHDSSPGFWTRMGRGLRRIASAVNPFH